MAAISIAGAQASLALYSSDQVFSKALKLQKAPWFPPLGPEADRQGAVNRFRRSAYIIIKGGKTTNKLGFLWALIKYASLLTSIVVILASSLEKYRLPRALQSPDSIFANDVFYAVESFCVAIFTLDVGIRLLCVTAASPPGMGPLRAILRFIFSWNFLIDMLSIVPFYVSLGLSDTSSQTYNLNRALAAVRVLQFARLMLSLQMFQVLVRTLEKSTLALVLFFAYLCVLIVFFSCIIFLFEAGTYDPSTGEFMRWNAYHTAMEPSPFRSIFTGLYYTIVTISTVGYGDIVPTSIGGRIVAALIIVAGLLTLSIPISIISSRFPDEYAAYEKAVEAKRVAIKEARRLARESLGTSLSPVKTDGGSGVASPSVESATASVENVQALVAKQSSEAAAEGGSSRGIDRDELAALLKPLTEEVATLKQLVLLLSNRQAQSVSAPPGLESSQGAATIGATSAVNLDAGLAPSK